MGQGMIDRVYWGNSVGEYLVGLTVIVAGLAFVKIVVGIVVRRLKRLAARTETSIDDFLVRILAKVLKPALYFICFYIGSKMVALPDAATAGMNAAALVVLTLLAARLAIMVVAYTVHIYLEKKREDPTMVRSLEGMLGVVKFLIWALAVIILLDNFGYKVSALLAGLGIGGVAVAIAAQALLKDFFSYFSIVFDRPFRLGDFIIIGEYMGTVEYIGIKTTRIRSLSGEQVVFSNTDLTDSRVRNYKLMEKRRALFRIGVTYQTPLPQLREIPGVIEQIIKRMDGAVFDRAHFASYGDFSLIFEVVYFVLSPDYNRYMDIQQAINLAIREEFERRGIEFAYPTQTVFVQQAPPQNTPR